jgi:hypothetical protein
MACKIFSLDPQLGKETSRIVKGFEVAIRSICADMNTRNDTAQRIECDDGRKLDRAGIERECKRRGAVPR